MAQVQPTEFMDVADTDFLGNNEHDGDDSSGSDSEFEKYFAFSVARNRLFGRKRPLHVVLGSGKVADIILWRDKKISTSTLVGVTTIWLLFERMDYTLLGFICDSLTLILTMLFFWTHLSSFIDISPPNLSQFILPKELLVNIAISMTRELNQLLKTFRLLALGQDSKKFLLVTMSLVTASALGNWFTAASLFYIVSIVLMTVPAVYERNEDIVDILAEKAMMEFNNLLAELMKKLFGISLHLQDNNLE